MNRRRTINKIKQQELIQKVFHNTNSKSLLKVLCKLEPSTLLTLLNLYLTSEYKKVISTKEYIYAKGDIPICMVAHLDTIRDYSMVSARMMFDEPITLIDEEEDTISCVGGNCLDDRLGVYIIIKLLQAGLRPSVIFTMGEERGCTGATALINDIPECPDRNLKFFIEVDRRGTNEVVYYQNGNQLFKEFIESFGFEEKEGTLSDITILMSGWNMCGCNVSAGYFHEHTEYEIGSWSGVKEIIKKLTRILEYNLSLLASKRFKFIENKNYYTLWTYSAEEESKEKDQTDWKFI